MTTRWKNFGVPLVARLPESVNGSTVHSLFLTVMNPFRQSKDVVFESEKQNCDQSHVNEVSDMDASSSVADCDGTADTLEGNCIEDEVQFYLADERALVQQAKIEMDEPISLASSGKRLHMLVCWQEKAMEQYDLSLLNTLPEIYKSGFFAKKSQDSFSLYSCLEAFLKEEPLGPEDMW